ncbi:S-adenosylmethionine-dependent_methyltransferase [Hexamita inflata]|uniref:S-adenosylmethionine-dependent_methyltransferase n=1 Tax=Hexamita inflata TaxID=28002 RepID=A0ABP1HZH6_9EUKA
MPRPEDTGPADLFYNEENADLYAQNARMNEIQIQLTNRALELLEIQDPPLLLLDIGCGTGLSTSFLNENGYLTIGVDISEQMLAHNETDNLMQLDIGNGLPFQPGTFDGAVSISVLQWLCYSNETQQDPFKRLFNFFTSLFGCLKPGAKAVFQFYPEHASQLQLIQDAAAKAGFAGRLQVDFPNSAKAKKMYLVLSCGLTAIAGKDKREFMKNKDRNQQRVQRSTKLEKGSREWILMKKAKQAEAGEDVVAPTKFTGKKRKTMWGF